MKLNIFPKKVQLPSLLIGAAIGGAIAYYFFKKQSPVVIPSGAASGFVVVPSNPPVACQCMNNPPARLPSPFYR